MSSEAYGYVVCKSCARMFYFSSLFFSTIGNSRPRQKGVKFAGNCLIPVAAAFPAEGLTVLHSETTGEPGFEPRLAGAFGPQAKALEAGSNRATLKIAANNTAHAGDLATVSQGQACPQNIVVQYIVPLHICITAKISYGSIVWGWGSLPMIVSRIRLCETLQETGEYVMPCRNLLKPLIPSRNFKFHKIDYATFVSKS